MHQLKQLDSEFDVAKTARTQLQLTAGLVGGQAFEHPPAHRLHVSDEVLALGRLPDHRVERRYVGAAQVGVPGPRPRLEQRLEFPGLGPALVIGTMAGQGPDQRAVPADRKSTRLNSSPFGISYA